MGADVRSIDFLIKRIDVVCIDVSVLYTLLDRR